MDIARAYDSYKEVVLKNPEHAGAISFGEYLFSLKYDVPLVKVKGLIDNLDTCYAESIEYRRSLRTKD